MQDLKLMIRFNFDGKNELEKIIDDVAKKHNLEVQSNLGQVKVDVDDIGTGFTNVKDKITSMVTKFGFFAQGLSKAKEIINATIRETVGLAREQVRAEKLVEGAVKATGAAAGFTANELKRMASNHQADSNFGDEAILAKVTSPLLTFKNVQGEVFASAQTAILDMSAALGQDLQQTSIQVGKALNDPILGVTTLRRVGVQLSTQQEQQIKDFMAVNKVAEAQTLILKELNSQFGGQAKNVIDPMIQLQNTWGDIKETIGFALLPMLNSLASSTKNWLNTLQPATSELEKVTKEANNQQAEFYSLTSAYETLRFKQNQTVETNVALKDIVDTINTKFGDNIGNVDLATISYENFKKAVANATDELIREAMIKQVATERSGLANEIAEKQMKQVDKITKQREVIAKRKEQLAKADENLQAKQQQYDNADSWNKHLYITPLTNASNQYAAAENLLAKAEAEIEKINEKYNKQIAEATKELEDYSNKYTDVLQGLGKKKKDAVVDGDNELTEAEKEALAQKLAAEQALIDAQIEALKNSLKTKEALLTDNYTTQKEFITLNVADETERITILTTLEDKYNADIKALKHQEFQEELTVAEKKKQLGILSYEDLKTTVDNYYEWVKANYDKDSKEYTDALNLMRNTNLRYGQELKKDNENLLKDTKETWQTAVKMFDLGIIPFQQLQTAFQNYKNMLQSTSSDADLTEDQINEITVAVKELDNQMQKVAKNQNWLSKTVSNINEQFDALNEQGQFVANTIASNLANMFVNITRHGSSFRKSMKALWRGLANDVIAEISRMMAKWLVFMALKGITALVTGGASATAGGLPLGTGEGSGFVGAASGGYIAGPGGPKDDAIPAWLSNGEFVVNAEKTAIFRGLLDYINYTPLSNLSKSFSNLSIPNTIPTLPKMNYSSGGAVAHPGFDLSGIENKLNKLDKVISELQELRKKDYNVQVSTKFRGVEFAKEVNKAQAQYKRIMG